MALASALVSLGLVEVALAVFHPVPYATEFNMYFEPDPHTGYRMRPLGKGFFQGRIPADANSDGLRDDETILAKPAGTFRILALGDSFTVGANVRQEEAWPQALEALLRDRPPPRIEVINAGIGGFTPFQYAQYYEAQGRRFGPDLVLIGFFVGNDAFDATSRTAELPTAVLGRRVYGTEPGGGPTLASYVKVALYSHSNLARLLVNRRREVIPGDQFGYDPARLDIRDTDRLPAEYVTRQLAKASTHLRRSDDQRRRAENGVAQVRRIHALAAERRVPVLVVLIPDENQVNAFLRRQLLQGSGPEVIDLSMPQTLLREMFAEAGIPALDLTPDFLSDPRRLYMNDTHWTPEGHLLAATRIAAALDGYLPAREPAR
jgi:lysophospholipase L1-like esterase